MEKSQHDIAKNVIADLEMLNLNQAELIDNLEKTVKELTIQVRRWCSCFSKLVSCWAIRGEMRQKLHGKNRAIFRYFVQALDNVKVFDEQWILLELKLNLKIV